MECGNSINTIDTIDKLSKFSFGASFDTVLKGCAEAIEDDSISLPFPATPTNLETVHNDSLEKSSESFCNILHVSRIIKKRAGKKMFEICYWFSPMSYTYFEGLRLKFLGKDIEKIVGSRGEALDFYKNHFDCVIEIYKGKFEEDSSFNTVLEVKEVNEYDYHVIVKGSV